MAPSQSSAISEVIDVDAINLDSDEIEYRGYRRDDTKEMHTLEFEREGVLYMGHHDQKNWELRRKLLAAQQKVLKPVGHLERATSSANEQGLRAVTAPLSTGDAASGQCPRHQTLRELIWALGRSHFRQTRYTTIRHI